MKMSLLIVLKKNATLIASHQFADITLNIYLNYSNEYCEDDYFFIIKIYYHKETSVEY